MTINTVEVVAGADTALSAQLLEPTLSAEASGSLTTPIEEFVWGTTTVSLEGINYPITKEVSPLASGNFSLSDLQPGLHQLTVVAEGHIIYSSLVDLSAGANTIEAINLVPIQESEEAVFLTSTVNLSGSSDHSGAQVRAYIGQQQQASDVSAVDGAFSLRLSPLNHTLTFSANGYLSQSLEVQWSTDRERFETIVGDESVALSSATITLEVNPGER